MKINWTDVLHVDSYSCPQQVCCIDVNFLLTASSAQHPLSIYVQLQVQGLDAAMQHMSPFRQRPRSIQNVLRSSAAGQRAVDPFSDALHRSLLEGLQPPLEQVLELHCSHDTYASHVVLQSGLHALHNSVCKIVSSWRKQHCEACVLHVVSHVILHMV